MNILIFIFGVICTLVVISRYLIKHQFKAMSYSRNIEKTKVSIDEEVKIKMIIENRSKIGIPFLFIKEYLPKEIYIVGKDSEEFNRSEKSYSVYLSINRNERLTRIYKIKAKKRGVYNIKSLELTIGDQFGLLEKTEQLNDFKELIVFPSFEKLSNINFVNKSLSGDEVIKRFIFDDPLMIKGIREYTVNHRMKDIHWNSSLRAGRLMVKEYDYTSDRDVAIILNVQCGQPSYMTMNNLLIEQGISLSMSIAEYCIEQGINTTFWTNSSLRGVDADVFDKTDSNASTVEPILEMGARINNWTRRDFSVYLQDNMNNFNFNSLYLIVTPFLDEASENILTELAYRGLDVKVIDTSEKGLNIASLDILRLSEEAII